MPKIIAYARVPQDAPDLTKFGIERGYMPNSIAEGDIASVIKLLDEGDTLVVPTIEVFNNDRWGGAVTVGNLIKAGVVVITIQENLVLKDDVFSTMMYASHCVAIMIRTHPDNQTGAA